MEDILVQYALDNVWCNPRQDDVVIFKPDRITDLNPAFIRLKFMGRDLYLPNYTSPYHVYYLGQINQDLINIPSYSLSWQIESWQPFSKIVNQNQTNVSLYTNKGICFPLFRSYYMYTNEGALIVAIENNQKINVNLINDDLYIRLYKNAFFSSQRSAIGDYYIYTEGLVLNTPSQITNLISSMNVHLNNNGYAALYINGYRFSNPSSGDLKIGDIAEYIYDATIHRVERIVLNTLPTFTSTLDGESKYILHSSSNDYNTIEYHDDLDIDIIARVRNNVYFGSMYPRISDSSIRMLTHRDYSIRSSQISDLINDIQSVFPSDGTPAFEIELKSRYSGYERPLQYNSSMVHELYKLNHTQILESLKGGSGTLDIFTADSLERSPYTTVMQSEQEEITKEQVETMFGYNALSKIFGDNIVKTTDQSGLKIADVPLVFQSGCTVYEYDQTGYYLGYYDFLSGTTYTATNNLCAKVEFINGKGQLRTSSQYGDNDLQYYPGYSYRVYACDKINGTPTYEWVDITQTNEYVIDYNLEKINFTDPNDSRYMMVRDDRFFLSRSLSLSSSNGILTFNIQEEVDRNQGSGYEIIDLEVPGSDFVLFLNGKSLIREIDYFVDYPTVYVINYNDNTQPFSSALQNIHYRVTGLGQGTIDFGSVFEKGLVNHGYLSDNDNYLVKEDKPLRIVINGALKTIDEVRFSEDYPTVEDPTNPLNGLPYQIQDTIIQLNNYTITDTYQLRETSKVIDSSVSTYLQNKLPVASRSVLTNIPPYPVVCPFYSRIVYDLINDIITSSQASLVTLAVDIEALVGVYEYLLEYSPCIPENGMTSNRYQRRPHAYSNVVVLPFAKYNFLLRVIDHYTPGLIELNPYILMA